jgi:hypothetical protein
VFDSLFFWLKILIMTGNSGPKRTLPLKDSAANFGKLYQKSDGDGFS